MSNIAISMFPEEGHLIPSFKLARMLQAEGHRVVYVGLADFEAFVRAQGFDYVVIMAQAIPAGARQQQVRNLMTKKGIAFLKEVSQTRFYRELIQLAYQNQSEIHHFLDTYQPDLFIIDGFLAPLALRVRTTGIPVVLLSININLPKADNYPPVVTNIVPDNTPASKSKANVAWSISALARNITSLLVGFHFAKELRRLASACDYAPDRVVDAALYPKLQPSAEMPEVILCPPEFDFPRPDGPGEGVHFIEPSIDLDRKTTTFAWDALDASKRIIFCTLGSQSHLYAKGHAFFQAVIDAVGRKPEWQLVLAVGPQIDPTSFHAVPANAIVVPWVPHADILRRAAIMINHGGLGTIKECIFFDVPMIVFPITRDQPGYAARVAYHGLGLMGNIRKVSEAQIGAMIDAIDSEPSFQARTSAMGAAFRALEDASPGIGIIEEMLDRDVILA